MRPRWERREVSRLRRDHRPYFLKRLDLSLQKWYVNYVLRPQFESLGRGCTFMGPRYVEVFGGPVFLGDHATVIATPDRRVRLTIWAAWEKQARIEIGRYCLICPGVRIGCATEVTIGDSCMMAQCAYITDADWHGIYDRSLPVGQSAPVHVGKNVWIGDSAIVCKGVTIGDNSIIGAGSIVVKDIPPNVIAAGNPAKPIKELDTERVMKTRADWLADPQLLGAQFAEIDKAMLKGNTVRGWLRSLIFPRPGD
ncbi:MAG: acyltransferase [Smithellaceae bacterium]|nr:acyltransferase [Smithellaceae bacterium]